MSKVLKVELILTLFLLVCGVLPASGQDVPDIVLTIESEQTEWRKGSPAKVHIKIENISTKEVELLTRLRFRLDDGTRGNREPTMANGFYYSPFGLVKSYLPNTANCQNDLVNNNIKRENGVVEIFVDKNNISLKAGEKKEFQVDLAGLCWGHQISSVYPMSDLFSEVKKGRYSLYFSIAFKVTAIDLRGSEALRSKSVESNKLTINIKQ